MADLKLRMSVAAVRMVRERNKVPRVYYLTPDDYRDYCGTGPDYDWVPFYKGSRPDKQFCPLFERLAVRQSTAKNPVSRLISCCGRSLQL